QSNLDDATVTLSHEVVEATTDPDPGHPAFTVSAGATWPGTVEPELADNEAQTFTYRVNGVLVQAYAWDPLWPQDVTIRSYLVPDGNNFQNYIVDGGTLFINGGQLAGNGGDTIEISTSPQGGVMAKLNGYGATFEPGAINSIVVNTVAGMNHVSVRETAVP